MRSGVAETVLHEVGFGRGRAVLRIPPSAGQGKGKGSAAGPTSTAHTVLCRPALPSARSRRRRCTGVQQPPPPLAPTPGLSEEQLPSSRVINPWCLRVAGVKLTPAHSIPSWLYVPQEQIGNQSERPSFVCHCCPPRGKITGEHISVIIVLCLVLTVPIKDAEHSQGLIKDCHCAN